MTDEKHPIGSDTAARVQLPPRPGTVPLAERRSLADGKVAKWEAARVSLPAIRRAFSPIDSTFHPVIMSLEEIIGDGIEAAETEVLEEIRRSDR